MKKSSIGLKVFAGTMLILGLLLFSSKLAEMIVLSFTFKAAVMASIGLTVSFIFGIILNNLTMTEEEGRLPEQPKEVGSKEKHGCCDSESG